MKTELTLNVLHTMNAQEYEDIRAAGSDERRELTHAVSLSMAVSRLPTNVFTWRYVHRAMSPRSGCWFW